MKKKNAEAYVKIIIVEGYFVNVLVLFPYSFIFYNLCTYINLGLLR